MRNFLIVLVVTFVMGTFSYAESKGKPMGSKKYNYGMAGCGVGSLVTQENTKLNQLAVWVIDTFVFGGCVGQTSSISTGTSNCTDKSADMSKIDREVYIAANFAEMQKEAAQGQGEHLAAFAQILGCEEQERLTFGKFSQENYGKIFGTKDPKAVLENYQKELRLNEGFLDNCSQIG